MSTTIPSTILRLGMHHPDVILLKKHLNAQKFGKLSEFNNHYGPATEEVVRKFQRTKLLYDDGVVGPMTWKRLLEPIIVELPVPGRGSLIAETALVVANTQLHVREKTGRNDGKEVEEYLRLLGLGKGYAWCVAFVYWCFNVAAMQMLKVANPLPRTAGVLDFWNKSKKFHVKHPRRGDLFVMDFGRGLGHMGVVQRVDGKYIETVEGNTDGPGSREGNGVFNRRRLISSVNKGFVRF